MIPTECQLICEEVTQCMIRAEAEAKRSGTFSVGTPGIVAVLLRWSKTSLSNWPRELIDGSESVLNEWDALVRNSANFWTRGPGAQARGRVCR